MADTGTIDMPQNVCSVVMYIMYANFGAFTYHKVKDWFGMPLHCYYPVGLVLPLHYSAIIEEVAAICTKGGGFTMKILVSSILVQYSKEIPAVNDIIVLHLLLDGGHFGLRPS